MASDRELIEQFMLRLRTAVDRGTGTSKDASDVLSRESDPHGFNSWGASVRKHRVSEWMLAPDKMDYSTLVRTLDPA